MPDISQLIASSYPSIQAEANKPETQFAGNALLTWLKKLGGVKTIPFGTLLGFPLDYQRNPGAEFIATDLSATSLSKTEVLTEAQYTEGQIVVPVTWTFADEAKNSSTVQKVDFVASLLENAMVSHDDLIEEALFGTSTNGFLGLQTLFPDNGQGTPGGIDAGTETWWRHYSTTYAAAGTDIEAKLAMATKTAAKSSGGGMPNLIISGVDPHNLYEGTQQAFIRYAEAGTANAGFKALKYGLADFIFSQYGPDDTIYGINTKNTKLYMAKGAARRMGKEVEITNQPGYSKKMYTMLQFATNNKSRNFVLTEAQGG